MRFVARLSTLAGVWIAVAALAVGEGTLAAAAFLLSLAAWRLTP